MAEAKWSMFREKVTQAGTFADPMLMLGIKNGLLRYPLEFDRDPTTAKVIGISQMLPIWGKRQLQRTVADQTARINGFDYEERRLELTRMIKETHAQLAYADQSLRLLDRSIAILDDLIRFADTMYAVGEAQQQDVLKAQVELSRMRDMQLAAQQQRRSLEATMNTLLARPVLTPFPEQTDVELVRVSADAVTLAALAEERRPILRRLETQREKGKTGQQLAQKEYYPDFTLAIEYMQIEPLQGDDMSMDGDDMFNLTLSFNLPFQQEKRHAMVRESLAETRMANEELQLTRNLIARDLADGLARLDRNRQMAELYQRTIIPQSQSALDAAIASYRVGKVDFIDRKSVV